MTKYLIPLILLLVACGGRASVWTIQVESMAQTYNPISIELGDAKVLAYSPTSIKIDMADSQQPNRPKDAATAEIPNGPSASTGAADVIDQGLEQLNILIVVGVILSLLSGVLFACRFSPGKIGVFARMAPKMAAPVGFAIGIGFIAMPYILSQIPPWVYTFGVLSIILAIIVIVIIQVKRYKNA